MDTRGKHLLVGAVVLLRLPKNKKSGEFKILWQSHKYYCSGKARAWEAIFISHHSAHSYHCSNQMKESPVVSFQWDWLRPFMDTRPSIVTHIRSLLKIVVVTVMIWKTIAVIVKVQTFNGMWMVTFILRLNVGARTVTLTGLTHCLLPRVSTPFKENHYFYGQCSPPKINSMEKKAMLTSLSSASRIKTIMKAMKMKWKDWNEVLT